jgi:acetylornithine deacetylase/succinyl-diaminopimelate desuccinylase-like protein
MKKLILSALMLTFIAIGVNAQATTDHPKKEKLEARLAKMTPEERAKFETKMAERKEKWASLSPEEKAAAKEKRKEMREKFKNMTPEERKAAKAEWKANHPKKG